MGQIWPKIDIFEVGQLFWKKTFFFKTIRLKDSPKFFLKKFGHFRPFYENLMWDHVFCIFIKNGRFGRFGRPIGRCGRTQKNRLELLSTKKFKISHSLKNSLRYLHFCRRLLEPELHKSGNKRKRPLNQPKARLKIVFWNWRKGKQSWRTL